MAKMKWGWAAAIVFLVLSLAACVQEEDGLVESTAVPTPLPTIEATVTETAVPATATVVEEMATPPIPTETPTPLSPLAEVPDLKQLSEVPFDISATYRLKTPDYDFLHDWLIAAHKTPERSCPIIPSLTCWLLTLRAAFLKA